MKILVKKILLSLACIFLIWQSYELLRNISRVEMYATGWIIFTAWILNLFITGIFAFAGFAFPTQKLMYGSYYTIRRPDLLIKAYNLIGVKFFRLLLLATLWKSQKQRKKYFDGRKNGILNLQEQSQKSEFGHLIPFIILSALSLYFLFSDTPKLGLFAMIINIAGNFYPIILQRHHRLRIQNMRNRMRPVEPLHTKNLSKKIPNA